VDNTPRTIEEIQAEIDSCAGREAMLKSWLTCVEPDLRMRIIQMLSVLRSKKASLLAERRAERHKAFHAQTSES